jgi:hypothetical protein
MTPEPVPPKRSRTEALVFVGFLVAWLVLQTWLLPKVGVRT